MAVASTSPLSRLEVAALLSGRMIERGSAAVVRDTSTALPHLLAMISGTADFNRPVLRYLGVRREILYYRNEDAGRG